MVMVRTASTTTRRIAANMAPRGTPQNHGVDASSNPGRGKMVGTPGSSDCCPPDPVNIGFMKERLWTPDPAVIADQLIKGYRKSGPDDGNLEAIATLDSWHSSARFHDDKFTQDDWIALVQELSWRAAFPGDFFHLLSTNGQQTQ